MQLRGYTIYDCKALQYHSPWFATTDGAAVRVFQDLVNDSNTFIGRHPTDYSLWYCGTYDDTKGFFRAEVPLVHVIDAAALVSVQPPLPFDPTTGPDRPSAGPASNGKDI